MKTLPMTNGRESVSSRSETECGDPLHRCCYSQLIVNNDIMLIVQSRNTDLTIQQQQKQRQSQDGQLELQDVRMSDTLCKCCLIYIR